MKKFSNAKGSYDDFLNAIRIFETTIDPDQVSFYADNYETPDIVGYQNVEYPGRVIRNARGEPTVSSTTIKGYFERLGIDKYYDKSASDPQMFRRMQYATMNYLALSAISSASRISGTWAITHIMMKITCRCTIPISR